MSDNILIYAELLHNIRALSIVITLQTESNRNTQASISTNGAVLSIVHDGEANSIHLPSTVLASKDKVLPLPSVPSKSLTYRLQLQEDELGLLKLEEKHGGYETPWSARQLSGASLSCKTCNGLILEPEVVADWRDLPHDNWAEMMDLWHCHKPHDDSPSGAASASKGYAAANHLSVSAGTGYASLLYVLLSELDQLNIKVNSTNVVCASCNAGLGALDHAGGAIKLFKQNLTLSRERNATSFPLEMWFSSQLLAIIDSEGNRRFLVEQEQPDSQAILCWVFSDDLIFSSSGGAQSRIDPTRAIKILWKDVDDPTETLRNAHMSLEHFHIDAKTYGELRATLISSANILPADMQSFQGWQIGLLRRFIAKDLTMANSVDDTLSIRTKS